MAGNFDAWKATTDLYALWKLQQIAANQAAQTTIAQQQASIAARQAQNEVRHAEAIEVLEEQKLQVETRRLNIEQERQRRDSQKQALKGDLFSLGEGLTAIETSADNDTFVAYVLLDTMTRQLQSMKVKDIGDYQDMTLHAGLLSKVRTRLSAINEKIPDQVAAFKSVLVQKQQVLASADAIDKRWYADNPVRLKAYCDSLKQTLREVRPSDYAYNARIDSPRPFASPQSSVSVRRSTPLAFWRRADDTGLR